MTPTRNPQRTSIGNAPSTGVAELTRDLAAHDEKAFREFHGRYFDRLYQFLLVVTRGQEHEAQEAVQETMLHVARRARAFQDDEAFWCWLKAVARNTARDGGRKQTRYRALLQRFFLAGEPELSSPRADEEDRLKTALTESLNELAPDERRLVEAKYLDGAAVRDLSSHAGLTEKAIESRLLRLRHRLRERLLKKLNEL